MASNIISKNSRPLNLKQISILRQLIATGNKMAKLLSVKITNNESKTLFKQWNELIVKFVLIDFPKRNRIKKES